MRVSIPYARGVAVQAPADCGANCSSGRRVSIPYARGVAVQGMGQQLGIPMYLPQFQSPMRGE